MKQKKEVKLHLNKRTIQDLGDPLDRNDQGVVNGGSDHTRSWTTKTPVYC